MNKQEFLNYLKEGTEDADIKCQVLQYYIDNYPVQIKTGFNPFTKQVGYTWTSLPDYKVKDDIIAMKNLDVNFNKLQLRIKELEDYDKE